MKNLFSNRRRAGFTLVELMVGVTLTVVILSSVYVIYDKSLTAYRIESQVLDMQDRLRFGLEHLKRDLRRAGFLASPNTLVDPNVCPKPLYDLRAVTVYPNTGSVFEPYPGANDNIEPSSLVLFGDFFSGQVYKTAGVETNKVYLQYTPNFPTNQVEFDRIFNTNRYLRIVTSNQFELLLGIQEADWAERSVTFSQAIPRTGAGSLCGIAGFGEGLDANVAGFVRYRVATDTRPGAPTGKTDLVREELEIDGQTVVAGTQLVIADYAVDLQVYDFGFDTDATGSNPSLVIYPLVTQVADASGGGFLGTMAAANPEDLRFLTVKLTVRSEDEDTDFSFVPREDEFSPLMGYDVSDMAGAARCMTLASRVELTSLAVRNLKGGTP